MGAAVITICGLAAWLALAVLAALITAVTGPPNVPPLLLKLMVVRCVSERVRLGMVSTELEPDCAPPPKRVLLITLAPGLIVTAPIVWVSEMSPARKEIVPPVMLMALVPIRAVAPRISRPELSSVSEPNGMLIVPVAAMVPLSRRVMALRTVSEPVPRLLALRSVQAPAPCLSRLMFPPLIEPEKVAAALGTVMRVAVVPLLLVIVPAPLA